MRNDPESSRGSGPSPSPLRRTSGAFVLAAALLAGCGADDDRAVASGTPAVPPASPSTAGPPLAAVPRVDLGAPQELVTGLDVPWGIAFLPDGSALVAERDDGRVLRLPPDGGQPAQVAVLADVAARGEGGLLGLAVPPDYDKNPWVYAYLTTDEDNRVVRFRLDAPADAEVVLAGIDAANVHNGGRIAFGPDGQLYVATGDAGDRDAAQDPDDPNGKILRLRPDGSVPPDNPTPGSPVYSLGHRNVQGLAWDGTGRLWATEFGQDAVDEVNLIEPGGNYGWPDVEGEGDTDGGRLTNPLVVWDTAEASPSGAVVVGQMLYVAALAGERLWAVPLQAGGVGEPRAELDGAYGRLRTVVQAPDGALWLSTSNGDGRGEERDGDDRIVRFPVAAP